MWNDDFLVTYDAGPCVFVVSSESGRCLAGDYFAGPGSLAANDCGQGDLAHWSAADLVGDDRSHNFDERHFRKLDHSANEVNAQVV